jgi:hypothetical protein
VIPNMSFQDEETENYFSGIDRELVAIMSCSRKKVFSYQDENYICFTKVSYED